MAVSARYHDRSIGTQSKRAGHLGVLGLSTAPAFLSSNRFGRLHRLIWHERPLTLDFGRLGLRANCAAARAIRRVVCGFVLRFHDDYLRCPGPARIRPTSSGAMASKRPQLPEYPGSDYVAVRPYISDLTDARQRRWC